MVTHSGVAGGMNNVVSSLLRQRPPGTEGFWVFLEPGPALDTAPVLHALVNAGRARELWKAPAVVGALRAAIRAARADLVFAHVTKAHLYAATAAWLEQVPYLWWQHERFGQKPLMHQAAGRLQAGAVICSADFTADEQRARFPATPVVRVHPGVAAHGLGPPREHRVRADVVIGIVGRLQRWKRVELAIRALPAVRAAVPRARLRVIGDAFPGLDEDYPAELRAEAAALGVIDAVEFCGEVADGAAAIAELDVLVHCAELEPFGLVPVEAMLRGVPVVVPDEGGPREIVREGIDGLRIDPRDTARLAAALVRLARDPALRVLMGAAGRARALAHFTEQRMAERAWAVAEAVAQGRDPQLP